MASVQAAQVGQAPAQQQQVVSKEYYVKVPKTNKRYHALKFHTSNVDLPNMNKAEMVRDVLPQTQKQEWEQLPKAGTGSEYGREAKELYRRKKFGFMAKKKNVQDMPWILSNKANDKQYIGKKSVSENSSYFVFIKCADGGFEASPLEDWYSFAPHKTYKSLNYDEAEEQFKIRHKTLNKYYIMANKRKNEGQEDDEEEEKGPSRGALSTFGLSSKASKDSWVSDGEDDNKKRGKKKSDYKSSNLSDDDEEEELNAKAKGKKKNDSDTEQVGKEDSDDGDQEGIEMDYSSSDSEFSEPEKAEEKYQEIGIDEEEAIKAQNKSDDSESEEDEDAGLTEAGKEYRKLMKKDDEKDSDEFDDIFGGKKNKDDGSSSSSSFDDSDFESELAKQKKQKTMNNNLKRKASDELLKKPDKKQVISHDESSSSSVTAGPTSKSTKTAAIIAAATANKQASNGAAAASVTKSADKSDSSVLNEEEVRRYLARKPMTSKELLHKFRGKNQTSQNKLSNQELVEKLRVILDKLKAKMIEQNGVKYLTLP